MRDKSSFKTHKKTTKLRTGMFSSYVTDNAKRKSLACKEISHDLSDDEDDIVIALATKKAESLSLPIGIRKPSELKWYLHLDEENGIKRYFPCRLCDASEAIYVNLEPLWDHEEVSLIQVLEYPSTKPFNGGKDRILADLSSLQPFNKNADNVWDKKIYKQYIRQRRKHKNGLVTLSESDAMAGYIFLNKILAAAQKLIEESDDELEHVENDSENDGDSWMETPYEVSHDVNSMHPQAFLDSKKIEPLRPGDVIRYCSPIFCAGDPRGKRLATVLSTDPSRSYMIRLDNNELLPNETLIKRVQVIENGKLFPHNGLSRPIESFVLKKRELKNQNAKTVLEAQAKALGQIVNRHVGDMQQKLTEEGLPIDLVNGLKSRREIADQQKRQETQNIRSQHCQKRRKEHSNRLFSEGKRERTSKRPRHIKQKRRGSKSSRQNNFNDSFSSSEEEFDLISSRETMNHGKTKYQLSDEDSVLQNKKLPGMSNNRAFANRSKSTSIIGDLNQNPGRNFQITRYGRSKSSKSIVMQQTKHLNHGASSSDDDSIDLKVPTFRKKAFNVGQTSLQKESCPASNSNSMSPLLRSPARVLHPFTVDTRPTKNQVDEYKEKDYAGLRKTTKNDNTLSSDDESFVGSKQLRKTARTLEPSDSESSMENHGLCLRRHTKFEKVSNAKSPVTSPNNMALAGKNKYGLCKKQCYHNDQNSETDGDSCVEDHARPYGASEADNSSVLDKKFSKRKLRQTKSTADMEQENAISPKERESPIQSLESNTTGAIKDENKSTFRNRNNRSATKNSMPKRKEYKKDGNRHLERIKRKRGYLVEEDDIEDSSEGSNRYMHTPLARGSYPSIVTSSKKKAKSSKYTKTTLSPTSFEEQENGESNRIASQQQQKKCTKKTFTSTQDLLDWQPTKTEKRKKAYGTDKKKKKKKNRIMPKYISTSNQVETSQLESSQG